MVRSIHRVLRKWMVSQWNSEQGRRVEDGLEILLWVLGRCRRHAWASVGRRPGHIFNLGHGIVPETPVDNVKRLVELVQSYQLS